MRIYLKGCKLIFYINIALTGLKTLAPAQALKIQAARPHTADDARPAQARRCSRFTKKHVPRSGVIARKKKGQLVAGLF